MTLLLTKPTRQLPSPITPGVCCLTFTLSLAKVSPSVPIHSMTADSLDEESPLFVRRLSIGESFPDPPNASRHKDSKGGGTVHFRCFMAFFLKAGAALVIVIGLTLGADWVRHLLHPHETTTLANHRYIPIARAAEAFLQVDTIQEQDIFLWYRTWGNPEGIPVLFVHGGPGNAIADYDNGNQQFFGSPAAYWVVEVDQRGTGHSQPSVRDHATNARLYQTISIDQIAADYELVRAALGIDQWIVFGGSFGSTLSLNYGSRYPDACLTLVLRGIYLDTPEEVAAVYARESYLSNPPRRAEFDTLYDYAVAQSAPEHLPADPNDAQGLLRAYYELILQGDEAAMWHWFVFENNLMETDPANLHDPDVINRQLIREARSVAFFETRLWITGSYERPSRLLTRMEPLTTMPVFICQGRRDEVCPPRYAHRLANALEDVGAYYSIRFLDSGHEQTDPVMALCLEDALHDFRHDFVETAGRRDV